MPKSRPSLTYLRFLHLAEAVRQMPSMPVLDALEERLMAALGAAWQVGKPVPVTDAARVLPGVSERTVFRRMKSLRAKGLLQFVGDEQDARIRHVKPTERAEAYFDGLGRCIEQARGKA